MAASQPVSSTLHAAIDAAKGGDSQRARELLSAVLASDPENELGWLWLSSVVESPVERRRCLEWVLALNPQSEAARRGLARLDAAPLQAEGESVEVRREYPPISAAAAVLYPSSQVRTWRDQPLLDRPVGVSPIFQAQPIFHDVWTRDTDLCGFCAAELDGEPLRCPRCGARLVETRFKYPRKSLSLILLCVMVFGAGAALGAHGMVDMLANASAWAFGLHVALAAALFLLAGGLYTRRTWAYVAVLALLPLAAATVLLSRPNAADIVGRLGDQPAAEMLQPMVLRLVQVAIGWIFPLELLATVAGLLVAALGCGGDFVRLPVRHIAQVKPGAFSANDYYRLGQSFASQGMWATAVLHWQRAAANDPARMAYRRTLGEAYARLGFWNRSLDVLEPAQHLATDERTRASIVALIRSVRRARDSASEDRPG